MTPRQVRAAELLRRGFTQREAALAVDRSERTIRSWLREVEGFPELATSAGGDEESPVDTLQAALLATKGDGSPDWRVRVAASRALLASGYEPPPVLRVPPGGIVVYPDALAEVLES